MKVGSWGEDAAEKYLRKKGYLILERNFRCRYGEIDIIAMAGTELVFLEVKTRRNLNYGLPCESVTAAKVKHLKRAVSYYASTCPIRHSGVRLDVIEILAKEGQAHIHHIENILG
ncbi:MAG TPA: YraN family protein [Anaerovoracaceae bacterium]|nr:YraN family protein [Anaerovoracaceae bacterium]